MLTPRHPRHILTRAALRARSSFKSPYLGVKNAGPDVDQAEGIEQEQYTQMSWSDGRRAGDTYLRRQRDNGAAPSYPPQDWTARAGPSYQSYRQVDPHGRSHSAQDYRPPPVYPWDRPHSQQGSYPTSHPDTFREDMRMYRQQREAAPEPVRTRPGHDHFYDERGSRDVWTSGRFHQPDQATPSQRYGGHEYRRDDGYRPLSETLAQRSYSTQAPLPHRDPQSDAYPRDRQTDTYASDPRASQSSLLGESGSYVPPHRRGRSAPESVSNQPLGKFANSAHSHMPSSSPRPDRSLKSSTDTSASRASKSKNFVIPLPAPDYIALSDDSGGGTSAKPTTKLLVLDLNGALIYRDQKGSGPKRRSFPRPYLAAFLEYLFLPEPGKDGGTPERPWEVFVWSSAQPHNVQAMVEGTFGDVFVEGVWQDEPEKGRLKREKRGEGRLVGVWARDKLGLEEHHYHHAVQTVKDLRLLSAHLQATLPDDKSAVLRTLHFDETNMVLLDDSPLKGVHQPWNEVVIPEYEKEAYQASRSAAILGDGHPVPDGMDDALLCVIGMLEVMRDVSNVPAWIRAGGLSGPKSSGAEDGSADSTRSTPPQPTLDNLPSATAFAHWHSIPSARTYWLEQGVAALERKGIPLRHDMDTVIAANGVTGAASPLRKPNDSKYSSHSNGKSTSGTKAHPLAALPTSSGASGEMRYHNDDIPRPIPAKGPTPRDRGKKGYSPSRPISLSPTPTPEPSEHPSESSTTFMARPRRAPKKPSASEPTRQERLKPIDEWRTFKACDISSFLSDMSERISVPLTAEQRQSLAQAASVLEQLGRDVPYPASESQSKKHEMQMNPAQRRKARKAYRKEEKKFRERLAQRQTVEGSAEARSQAAGGPCSEMFADLSGEAIQREEPASIRTSSMPAGSVSLQLESVEMASIGLQQGSPLADNAMTNALPPTDEDVQPVVDYARIDPDAPAEFHNTHDAAVEQPVHGQGKKLRPPLGFWLRRKKAGAAERLQRAQSKSHGLDVSQKMDPAGVPSDTLPRDTPAVEAHSHLADPADAVTGRLSNKPSGAELARMISSAHPAQSVSHYLKHRAARRARIVMHNYGRFRHNLIGLVEHAQDDPHGTEPCANLRAVQLTIQQLRKWHRELLKVQHNHRPPEMVGFLQKLECVLPGEDLLAIYLPLPPAPSTFDLPSNSPEPGLLRGGVAQPASAERAPQQIAEMSLDFMTEQARAEYRASQTRDPPVEPPKPPEEIPLEESVRRAKEAVDHLMPTESLRDQHALELYAEARRQLAAGKGYRQMGGDEAVLLDLTTWVSSGPPADDDNMYMPLQDNTSMDAEAMDELEKWRQKAFMDVRVPKGGPGDLTLIVIRQIVQDLKYKTAASSPYHVGSAPLSRKYPQLITRIRTDNQGIPRHADVVKLAILEAGRLIRRRSEAERFATRGLSPGLSGIDVNDVTEPLTTDVDSDDAPHDPVSDVASPAPITDAIAYQCNAAQATDSEPRPHVPQAITGAWSLPDSPFTDFPFLGYGLAQAEDRPTNARPISAFFAAGSITDPHSIPFTTTPDLFAFVSREAQASHAASLPIVGRKQAFPPFVGRKAKTKARRHAAAAAASRLLPLSIPAKTCHEDHRDPYTVPPQANEDFRNNLALAAHAASIDAPQRTAKANQYSHSAPTRLSASASGERTSSVPAFAKLFGTTLRKRQLSATDSLGSQEDVSRPWLDTGGRKGASIHQGEGTSDASKDTLQLPSLKKQRVVLQELAMDSLAPPQRTATHEAPAAV